MESPELRRYAEGIIKELVRNTDMTSRQIEAYLDKKPDINHRWKVHIIAHTENSGIVRYMRQRFHYYKHDNGRIDIGEY